MAGAHFFLQKFGGHPSMTYRYSLDRTPLRRYHAAESARAAVTRAYQALPDRARQALRTLLRRGESGD